MLLLYTYNVHARPRNYVRRKPGNYITHIRPSTMDSDGSRPAETSAISRIQYFCHQVRIVQIQYYNIVIAVRCNIIIHNIVFDTSSSDGILVSLSFRAGHGRSLLWPDSNYLHRKRSTVLFRCAISPKMITLCFVRQ